MNDGNYFGGTPSGVRPNMARGPVPGSAPTPPPRPSKPVGIGNARWVIGLVVLGLAGAAVFGFMTFVNKSGKEIGSSEQHAIQQGQDVSPKVDLQNALVAAKSQLMGDGGSSYQGLTAASLSQVEPALRFTDGASTRPGLISVFANGNSFGAAEVSSSGTCFYIRDTYPSGTTYGTGSGNCTARDALLKATSTNW